MNYRYLLVCLCLSASLSVSVNASTWINEFHYDNSGTDTDEGIEIAAQVGTDLSGFELQLYNGSNGEVYQSILLSGIVTDQQAGFGTLFFAISGIQNGPDGIALVDSVGTTLQFISYEGSFVANGGAADGMQSVDIQVFENSDAKIGSSLQLSGTGQSASDFMWVQAEASYGQFNQQQQLATPVPLPASMPLLLAGLGYLFTLKKRPSKR